MRMDLSISFTAPDGTALYVFLVLAAIVGIVLLYGAYRTFTQGNLALALLFAGTLLMLINPVLAIVVMVVGAIIIAIGGDVKNALLALVFTVAAFILATVIAAVVMGVSVLFA